MTDIFDQASDLEALERTRILERYAALAQTPPLMADLQRLVAAAGSLKLGGGNEGAVRIG